MLHVIANSVGRVTMNVKRACSPVLWEQPSYKGRDDMSALYFGHNGVPKASFCLLK